MITTLSFDLDDTLWDPRSALIAADKAQWFALAQRYPDLAGRLTCLLYTSPSPRD